jgi:hypothetical protein
MEKGEQGQRHAVSMLHGRGAAGLSRGAAPRA